jgi:hypothetical protein
MLPERVPYKIPSGETINRFRRSTAAGGAREEAMTLDKAHFVNLENGKFSTTGVVTTSPDDLRELFRTYQTHSNRDRLVIHFHGGLVGEEVGVGIAERLLPEYVNAGAYPVFFIWEAGWNEVLLRNLSDIFAEKVFKRLHRHVLRFLLGKLKQPVGERGGDLELPDEFEVRKEVREPEDGAEPYRSRNHVIMPEDSDLLPSEEEQLRELLEQDSALADEAERIVNGLRTDTDVAQDAANTRGMRVEGSTESLLSPDILADMQGEAPSGEERGIWLSKRLITGGITAARRTIVRWAKGRHHGVQATVVEELLREFYLGNAGKVLWDEMKKDTSDAFEADPAVYAGTAFLGGLKSALEAADEAPRIVLVGHSTGAVYISNFIRSAAQVLPPDVKFEVVFLAAAVSFDELASMLAEHADRVSAYRSFGMSDILEQDDRLVPILYPHSLLYFVSGVLEDTADEPLVGMERYYSTDRYPSGDFPMVEAGRNFVARFPAGAVWATADGGPGRSSSATSHTAFDDEHDTIASLRAIITDGFV